MKEQYEDLTFKPKTLDMIAKCNTIITEYKNKGFMLTIRQLYYQLVARGFVPNSVQSYDNVQNTMNKARIAGLSDWDVIEDRTRDLITRSHWAGVQTMLESAASWYYEDMWREQEHFVIVIVEKEALAGIFQSVLDPLDVPLLPARGYASATALRDLAKKRMLRTDRKVVVLHFGDHDPSGIDCTRDLRERLEMFTRNAINIDFRRMALTMEQVEELQPPPFPAKVQDARYRSYVDEYGEDSWELDALTPEYLKELIENTVHPLINWDQWAATERRIERRQAVLQKMADEYDPDDGTDVDPTEDEE